MAQLLENNDVVFQNINPFCRDYTDILKATNKPVLVDIHDYDEGNPYHDDFIEVADIVVASATHISDQRSFLDKMIKKGKKLAVVTNSSKGLNAMDFDSNFYKVDGYNDFEFVDSNGAGDSFCAGLMLKYYETQNYREALEFANVCGGISCTSEDLFNMSYTKEMIEFIVQKKKS